MANPQIIKVGKNVVQDLKNLEEDSHSQMPFVGGIDIAHLAKDKGIILSSRMGLAGLCEQVLNCTLEKTLSTRVSINWSNPELTPSQIQYAALDVWASLQVYLKLVSLKVPTAISFAEPITFKLPVLIFSDDRTRAIARGHISPETSKYTSLAGINVTATRAVVMIEEIYVPAAVLKVHRGLSLADKEFGPVPFLVVCRKEQVRSFEDNIDTTRSNTLQKVTTSHQSPTALDPLLEIDDMDEVNCPGQSDEFAGVNIAFSNDTAVPPLQQKLHKSHTISQRVNGKQQSAAVFLKTFSMFFI